MPNGPPILAPARKPLEHLLLEALGRVASPHACDSVLLVALSEAALEVVPDDLVTFRRFVLGPLKRAMILTLSPDLAEAVLDDIGPIVERAASTITSGVRSRTDKSKALLIASSDEERVRVLTALAPPSARVRVVSDVFQLLVGAESNSGALALVIDRSLPSVRPAALVTLARVLPPTVSVILWGFAGFDETETLPVSWVKLDGEVTAEAVIALAFPKAESEQTVPDAERPTARPAPAATAGSHQRLTAAAPTRVLVVSEDATLRGTIVKLLEPRGIEVFTAPDGFLAMELAAERGCDVIVAEERMKRLDGSRLTMLLRRMMGANAPAVVLIANQPAFVGGVAEVLIRGVDDARIFDVVERLRAARR